MTEAVEAGPVLAGERVRLRPARDDDAQHFIRWGDDPEFARSFIDRDWPEAKRRLESLLQR